MKKTLFELSVNNAYSSMLLKKISPNTSHFESNNNDNNLIPISISNSNRGVMANLVHLHTNHLFALLPYLNETI